MGFFHFFKKQRESLLLDITEVNQWLDKYIERQEMGTQLAIIRREIGSKATKLKLLLEALEQTTLKNPKLYPEREITVMEGNRKSYIHKIETFLKSLRFPEKYDDMKSFLEKISEDIEALAADTQKNFFILKEFMETEVSQVANKIAELDKTVAVARTKLENTALDIVKEVKQNVDDYHSMQQEIYTLRKNAQEIEDIKLRYYERRAKIEDKINNLKKGTGFADLQKLIDKKEELKEELSKSEAKIKSLFSDIGPALKKYGKAKKDTLINKYVKDSLKSFIEDETLKITTSLKKVLQEIDKLELKEKKQDRIKKKLEKIEDKELKKIREKIINLNEEVEDISKRVKNHSIKLNIKEQEGWMQSTDKDIKEENDKLKEIELKLERLNPNLIKQKIKEKIKKLDESVELKK